MTSGVDTGRQDDNGGSRKTACVNKGLAMTFFLITVSSLMPLAVLDVLYQQMATRRDRKRFPASGRLIDVDGRAAERNAGALAEAAAGTC